MLDKVKAMLTGKKAKFGLVGGLALSFYCWKMYKHPLQRKRKMLWMGAMILAPIVGTIVGSKMDNQQ
jgi:hypothetical protein